jgi:hypothetical protein
VENDDVKLRPPKQILEVEGPVTDDAHYVNLQATLKGSDKGQWKSPFGVDSLTLSNTRLKLNMDPAEVTMCRLSPEQSPNQNPGTCGVPRVDIVADAALTIHQGTSGVRTLKEKAIGHIDVNNPQNNRLLLGDDGNQFRFTVEGDYDAQYNWVQVTFPVSNYSLAVSENIQIEPMYNGLHIDKMDKVFHRLGVELPTRPCLDQNGMGQDRLGPHGCVQQPFAPFYIETMTPLDVRVNDPSPDNVLPFLVKYRSRYFGQHKDRVQAFSLEDLANTRKAGYKTKFGFGSCPQGHVVRREFGYNSVAQVQRKCASIENCLTFAWGTIDEGSSAVFCSSHKLFTKAKIAKKETRFVVGMRKDVHDSLIGQEQTQFIVKRDLKRAIPHVLSRAFGDHAGLYGYSFKPNIVNENGTHWMDLKVEPTEYGIRQLDEIMETALLEGAQIISANVPDDSKITEELKLVEPRGNNVSEIMDHAGEFLIKYSEHLVAGEIASGINLRWNAAMKFAGSTKRRPVDPYFAAGHVLENSGGKTSGAPPVRAADLKIADFRARHGRRRAPAVEDKMEGKSAAQKKTVFKKKEAKSQNMLSSLVPPKATAAQVPPVHVPASQAAADNELTRFGEGISVLMDTNDAMDAVETISDDVKPVQVDKNEATSWLESLDSDIHEDEVDTMSEEGDTGRRLLGGASEEEEVVLEEVTEMDQATSSADAVVPETDSPPAPEGFCANHTDTNQNCGDHVAKGYCDAKWGLNECARTCCDGGYWSSLEVANLKGLSTTLKHKEDREEFSKMKKILTVPSKTLSAAELEADVSAAADKAMDSAKQVLAEVKKKVQYARDTSKPHVLKLVNFMRQYKPRISSIKVDRIYLECLYGGKCDARQIHIPDIKMCFTIIGCFHSRVKDTPSTPINPHPNQNNADEAADIHKDGSEYREMDSITMADFSEWLEKSVTERLIAVFRGLVKTKQIRVDVPAGVDFVWQPTNIKGNVHARKKLKVLTGTVHATSKFMDYVVSLDETQMSDFAKNVRKLNETTMHTDTKHELPEDFTTKGAEKKAMSKIDVTSRGPNGANNGATIVTSMAKQMDKTTKGMDKKNADSIEAAPDGSGAETEARYKKDDKIFKADAQKGMQDHNEKAVFEKKKDDFAASDVTPMPAPPVASTPAPAPPVASTPAPAPPVASTPAPALANDDRTPAEKKVGELTPAQAKEYDEMNSESFKAAAQKGMQDPLEKAAFEGTFEGTANF